VTSSRLLARNTVLNLLGQVAPLAVAVIAVPKLITALGSARFGILTLAWALIGYFSLFDFGIARALTQAVSEALGRGDTVRLREVSGKALTMMFLFGCAGSIVIAILTRWLCYHVLRMPEDMRAESTGVFYLLAVSLPFVLLTLGFRGLLEAHQHFGLATALRIPYSLWNFLGPLSVLPFSHRLIPIVATLVAGRVVTCAAHIWFSLERYPWLRETPIRNRTPLLPLLRLGGWMTVSNIISPLMVYMDRFVIGSILSMSAVAFYVTPFEVVSKLLFVPAAVLGVFFPAFASTFVQDRARTATLFDRSSRFMLATIFPVVLGFVALGRDGLLLWVGPEYARQSTVVLQILAAGVLINSFAQVPSALLQAIGRADLTARGHMVELPIYAAMLFWLTSSYGLAGVAAAWTGRMILDTAILSWFTYHEVPEARGTILSVIAWLAGMSAVLLAVSLLTGTWPRAVAAAVTLILFLAISWNYLVSPAERSRLVTWLRVRRPIAAPEIRG
jgi:O-antigen/teichoic acid export membrane protein